MITRKDPIVQQHQAFIFQPNNDDNSITFSSFNPESLSECWDELYLDNHGGQYKMN